MRDANNINIAPPAHPRFPRLDASFIGQQERRRRFPPVSRRRRRRGRSRRGGCSSGSGSAHRCVVVAAAATSSGRRDARRRSRRGGPTLQSRWRGAGARVGGSLAPAAAGLRGTRECVHSVGAFRNRRPADRPRGRVRQR